MKVIAVIPARYASTRFPAKLMEDLAGKTIIRRTYEATLATGLFDDVFVATDSELIYNEIINHGGKAVMSIKEHESGSDRIAEAVKDIEADIVINVQGDEPFVSKENLEKLIDIFQRDETKQVDLASLMTPIDEWTTIENPNNVKVVVDDTNTALYFSRSVIPYPRDKEVKVQYYQHIGVYAFRKEALLEFTTLPMKFLEASEKLEQLRYLEYGKRIKMAITKHLGIGIDTPEDLERAKQIIADNPELR
ncbi:MULTISPECIES: 3-deoxy-manno-octulosonate cytidylyltransferase [Myroides]|uniref:3-deoxy-manno-octulosonate cytidylyltransferase n=1 Tax=Myroides TaxID=76831 RepID=UPI000280A8D6|nr:MULTISPECIES: 3-deoxy-manno-octulosonate cytidylyltransferase [Myroides]AJA70800.1 3-deoxy-D-manno-octulosonate cytidylyltransferase [Myroides sp. A21]APA94004.1 3-deoxy-D-manno-octulosonate cytidylyltransferase [Myroides sp. ZB35]EKB05469.1 3-deoxy-manno-octulosonate cytidylyltransferase [Myroides odoratimimus CCUG 3837]MDM1096342.1 3-deoxy-manno-octulosonate cytidylyltransferase [Myroides odoratimimus]MDM1508934.1 3-deoxy-manno-octulosonate cytidylyltransferase [Myroides odoratimimus]